MNRLPSKPLCDNRKSKIENLKWVALLAIAFVFAFGGAVVMAQQAGKILRIGFLDPSTASGSAVLVDAFRQELSKLGWIEGKNFTIEYRLAEGKSDHLPELAASGLSSLHPDIITLPLTPDRITLLQQAAKFFLTQSLYDAISLSAPH